MRCLNCHKVLYKDVTIKTIFKKDYDQICESCFEKMDMINHFDVLPIENGVLINYTIFELKYMKDSQSLSQFVIPYLMYFIKNCQADLIYFSDQNDDEIESLLLQISLGNIHHVILYKNKE